MIRSLSSRGALLLFLAAARPRAAPAAGAPHPLRDASTTSVRDSGLLDDLLPRFREETGIEVHLIAVGTGKALKLGERGDVDAVLVHDRDSELRFVEAGFGIERQEFMYNFYVLLGPAADPAGVREAAGAGEALRRIAESGAPFTSRGDDSGTHKAELRLWQAAGVDPRGASGTWYRETGSGMGATLNVAAELGAYALSDSGTWLSFGNRGSLETLVSDGDAFRNVYGVMLVNPERHPGVRVEEARKLIAWLTSSSGQAAIGAFRLHGKQAFHPLLVP